MAFYEQGTLPAVQGSYLQIIFLSGVTAVSSCRRTAYIASHDPRALRHTPLSTCLFFLLSPRIRPIILSLARARTPHLIHRRCTRSGKTAPMRTQQTPHRPP